MADTVNDYAEIGNDGVLTQRASTKTTGFGLVIDCDSLTGKGCLKNKSIFAPFVVWKRMICMLTMTIRVAPQGQNRVENALEVCYANAAITDYLS